MRVSGDLSRRKYQKPLLYSPEEASKVVIKSITNEKHTALVVEGKSDYCFWNDKRNQRCDMVAIAKYDKNDFPDDEKWSNKEAVTKTIEEYYSGGSWRKSGAIGIIDEDYDWDSEYGEYSKHLISTSPNTDLENILFHHDKIGEWISNNLVDTQDDVKEYRQHAIEIAEAVGVLRALCAEQQRTAKSKKNRYDYSLKFKLEEDDPDWLLPMVNNDDIHEMIRIIINNTNNKCATEEDVNNQYRKDRKKYSLSGKSSRELANGHDISRILALMLNVENHQEAERWVRDNLSLMDIKDTRIILKIMKWEDENKPFKVLVDIE